MTLAEFQASAMRAADAVRSAPAGTRWLLACDIDADGLAAGAVAAQALRKAGIRFTVRASRDKDEGGYRRLFAEEWDGLILLDKGSSHLHLLSELALPAGRRVVVVDHHNVAEVHSSGPAGPALTLLNPRTSGLDGSRDASASTTAVAFALALCGDTALPWAPTGLAGAVGDLQHEGGWRGWNLELATMARKSGHLASMPVPRLAGLDLAAALARLEPAVPGLHGDVAAAIRFLEGLGIERDGEVEDLDAESRTRLLSALVLRFLAAGTPLEDPAALLQETDRHVALGASLRHVYRVADACGREGSAATGIAYLMGDKGARADALLCLATYRATLAEAVQALRAKGPEIRQALQIAWTERPAYSGLVAGIAMESSVADQRRPVAVLVPRPDGHVQVSTRGTHALVEAGMDLGWAIAAAARTVGSEGGGHPVAAGAVVAEENVPAFLQALDGGLLAQGFLAKVT